MQTQNKEYITFNYSGKSVTDVYMEVGFKNRSHFSKAFKKQFGTSPSNYSHAI